MLLLVPFLLLAIPIGAALFHVTSRPLTRRTRIGLGVVGAVLGVLPTGALLFWASRPLSDVAFIRSRDGATHDALTPLVASRVALAGVAAVLACLVVMRVLESLATRLRRVRRPA